MLDQIKVAGQLIKHSPKENSRRTSPKKLERKVEL